MSSAPEQRSSLSATKQALLKIRELKQQLASAAGHRHEPIAIVSAACRFPRSSNTPEAFWESLSAGNDEIGEIPNDRWDRDAYFDADPEAVGKIYTIKGAFLERADQMDAEFFGISPREASWVDPQQRLLMEVCWEALERAAWSPQRIGSETGVFVGWMHNDYQNECSDSLLHLNPYIATGSAGSFLCGRLSYQLGLQGPSMAVDTACSSSLVALHAACQSLNLGECDRAVVGGVSYMASPKTFVLTCKLRALSPHGHSRAFDASADGYVRGEGCGVVTLRRLADARRDGDPILAVIRGSAITHNGNSSGLTAPNPQAQERAISEALKQAGIKASEVDYLEAHGTGTELGDPIELKAAAAVLGAGRDPQQPLLVGSVKTNVGHLEAAAGMAGLIKAVLALQHGEIPRHLHFRDPNPHIPWDEIPVKIVTKHTPWPHRGNRLAGVSAFGMSGTNAHVILESAPHVEAPAPAATPDKGGHHLLVLSGKIEPAVQELAQRYRRWFETHPEAALADVCHTAATGRRHFEHRAALVVDSVERARELLQDLERGSPANNLLRGMSNRTPRIAWQFTGQGSQYVGMAEALYEAQPVFRATLQRCDQYLRELRGESLLQVMFHEETLLNQTTWTQPALFALEMGLAELLLSWGLKPDAVLGHSLGQFPAACVAGILSWEDGLRLVSERSRLVGALPPGGAMAAVFAKPADIEQVLGATPDVSVAAFNGAHIVISGPEGSVATAVHAFSERDVRCKRLTTSHAFHSALMEPVADEFVQAAGQIEYHPPQYPLICNVTGKPLAADELLDAEYWWRHLRQPVQYAESMRCVSELGCDVILELGPQPILTGMAAGCLRHPAPPLLSCLRRDQDDTQALLTTVGELYVRGATPDFEALDQSPHRRRVQLPTYPFQRQYYWGPPKPQAFQAEAGMKHPLLGAKRSLAGVSHETRWEHWLASDNPRWLTDHQVFGDVVFPGAGYVEMALAAAKAPTVLQDISFEVPLRLAQRTCVQTVLRRSPEQPASIEVYSTAEPSGPWMRNFAAVASSGDVDRPADMKIEEVRARCPRSIDPEEFYAEVHGLGLQYGQQFQTIRALHRGSDEVLVELQAAGDIRGCVIPPMLLDGAFHSLAAFLEDEEASLFLPVGIERLTCFAAVNGTVFCLARWADAEGELRSANLTIVNDEGSVLVEIEGLKLRRVSRAALRQLAGSGPERLMYSLKWRTATLTEANQDRDNWLVVADDTGQDGGVAEALEENGQRCVRLTVCSEDCEAHFDDDRCVIAAANSQHWHDLLERYFPDQDGNRLNGVTWIVGRFGESDAASLNESAETERVCTGILALLHALRAKKIDRLDRGLQIVTRYGVAIHDDDPITPHMSQFWGLGRVVASEQPILQCRLIDADDISSSSTVVELLLCTSRESQIAVRSGQRYIPRLTPAKLPATGQAFGIENEASYLITGGLGALGLQAARWLAEHGAGHIVLVSRRVPGDSACATIEQIEQLGSHVVVESVDVTKRDEVQQLFQRIDQDLPPLKGIVHAAGVLDDGMLSDQNWQRFERVLAPKKLGARLLHEFTADLPLDFFVLYSSAASILGSPGQANYATANAFMDGLAQRRIRAGLPGLSVNWGPWYEGMAAPETVAKGLAQQGITPLTAEESHQILEQLIDNDWAQATVLDADWRRLRLRFGGAVPRVLEEVAGVSPYESDGESVLLEKIRSESPADRARLITTHIQNELQQILSLPSPPDPETGLAGLGLDSLMGVELSNRLQQQMGADIAISPTLAFDYPSVEALAEYLLQLVQDLGEPELASPLDDAPSQSVSEDIAIIGMGCRFPGAENLDQYWRLLRDGIDAIGEIPPDRWDREKYYSPNREAGKMYTREGGFLPAIGDFDADFFGISGPEACWMDPQHRMLLEVTWEALEHAGIAPDQIPNPRVGVFVGIMAQEYGGLASEGDVDAIEGFQGAGLAHSAGVGRISYAFGFQGPSMAIDTASSSSLVAISQAMKSLLDGDCNLALAGGANAILAPGNSLLLCKAGFLAADGRCKSFSAAADGFARGEGCGMVVLKRRSDAERDGDRILAVIRGSAVCHNGYSASLTAPSRRSQERTIRDALASAGMQPADVQYLEAHGTGTKFGDAIELQAAAAVLGQGRSAEHPLLVGSVKANVGHLESAGGISGLIKVVLSMQHGLIPQQLHFEQPNPEIPWDQLPVRIATEPTAWPDDEIRTAGITALGMSGTNAHLVLSASPGTPSPGTSSPATPSPGESTESRPRHLLALSARTPEALGEVAHRLDDFFNASHGINLADACYTAAVGRKHFEHRAALVVESVEQAQQLLGALRSGECAGRLARGQAKRLPRIAWVFTAEALPNHSVGRELYATQPVFREALDRCDALLRSDFDGAVCETLFDADARRQRWTQPALFALQMALDQLWRSWGIQPDVVFGPGWGHYAGACAAGVMTWENGLRLVAERGRLENETPSAEQNAWNVFEEFADALDYFPADRQLICNLSGDLVPEHKLLAGRYWRRHATEPLRITAGVRSLAEADCDFVLEIGPRPALCELAGSDWPKQAPTSLPSLVPGEVESETDCILQTLGKLYVGGATPDFAAFDEPWRRMKIGLPTYPFERKRYWITEIAEHTVASTGAEAMAGKPR